MSENTSLPEATQLAQRIVVLHREPGYIRLALPKQLCAPNAATQLESGTKTLPGVQSARIEQAEQQLLLRYDPTQLTTAGLAQHLFAQLIAFTQEAPPTPEASPPPLSADFAGRGIQPLLDKLRALVLPPEDAPVGTLQARLRPLLDSALTEPAITNFFNDIVAFYLIKVHWDLITRRWIQSPLAHSNAWLATFYLVFLLVRYRKQQ